jgi:hypothetical protein
VGHLKHERLFSLFILVGLIIFYFTIWRSVRSELTDFPPFYAAARLLQSGENPYNVENQCRVQGEVRSDLCMPFNHTPVLLPLIASITNQDYVASYKRWSLILLIVVALSFIPAYYLSRNFDSSVQALLFVPVFISITQGQDTAFILLAVFLWTWLLMRKMDFWAGIALSLAVLKPQIALLLALPLLFSRPKAFVGFCVGSLAAALFGLWLVGPSGYLGLIEIAKLTARGQMAGLNHVDMYSAAGILARVGISPTWVWLVFALTLVAVSLLWRKWNGSVHSLSLGIIGTIIAAPHLLFHDLAMLTVPIYLVHPFAPIIATFILLSFRALGAPYLGAYVVITLAALFHVNKLRNANLDQRKYSQLA